MKGIAYICVELQNGEFEILKKKKINLTKDTFTFKDRTFIIKPEDFIMRKKNTFYYIYEIDNPNPIKTEKHKPMVISSKELDSLINSKILSKMLMRLGFDYMNIIMMIVLFALGFSIGYIVHGSFK
jgi:hypothetical protein